METNNAFPGTGRSRIVVFLLASLALMVFAAVVFKVENPSIVQREERQEMPGGGMGQMGGDMAGITAMMQKLQTSPEDVETMRNLGMAFMDMRAWDRSLAFWDMVLERQPDDVMALNQKGFCLFELEKYAEAAVLFEKMLGIEPGNAHAHYNLGVIYKHYLSEPNKADVHFQAVLDAKPDDPELVRNARESLSGK